MSRRAPQPVHVAESETGDDWIDAEMPRVLAAGWQVMDTAPDGARYYHPLAQLMSGAREQDGRRWLHVSCSHQRRMPNWLELREVKDLFLGRDRYAYQVLPPDSKYVNIDPRVLHLWHCLDEDPLPDFTAGSQSL